MAAAAAGGGGNAGNVIVTLIADHDTIPKRSIFLDKDNSVVPIGRASKVSAKGFVATHTNAWFESPVMSRKHAELYANLDQKKVYVRDIGSLHGTYMNPMQESSKNIKLIANELYELQEGAELTLGVPIWRSSEEYTPTSLRVSITHGSEDRTETCDRKPKQSPPISTFSVPDDDYSSDDNMSEPSLSSPLPKQVVSAMRRAIKKHAMKIEYANEATGTGANPVDLTYEKNGGHELIDLTPEEQRHNDEPVGVKNDDNTSSHITTLNEPMLTESCINHDDNDGHDDSEVEAIETTGMIRVDSRGFESEALHMSDSGSEASSGRSSSFDDLTSRCSHEVQVEFEAATLDDTDEEMTDAMNDDRKEEHGQQRDIDETDPDNDSREHDSPAFIGVERERQYTIGDHDVDDTDDSVSENDDSSESEEYLSDEDILNPNDPDVAAFHQDGSRRPPHVSDSFGPAIFSTVRPGHQNNATSKPPTSVTPADCIQFGYHPVFSSSQSKSRLITPLWAGNRVCSRRSLHDVVATEKLAPVVQEITYQVMHPGETAVGTTDSATHRDETENTYLSTSKRAVLTPLHGHLPPPFAGMGTLTTKEDEPEAISSAHELEVQRRDSMKVANMLVGSPQPEGTLNNSEDRPQAPVKGDSALAVGKRKSDDISTINEAEEAWESRLTNHFVEAADILSTQPAQSTEMSAGPDESNMAIDLEDVPDSKLTPTQTSPEAVVHIQPSDPPSAALSAAAPTQSTVAGAGAPTQQRQVRCVVRRGVDVRPAKRRRIRHIAERLGYAALGGVSVGAAIVTTLIYTAPTF